MRNLMIAGAFAALALAPTALLAQRAPNVSEIVVTKITDSASSNLFNSKPNARLTFVRADGSRVGPIEAYVAPGLFGPARAGASGTGKTLSAAMLGKGAHLKEAKLTARKAGGSQEWLRLKREAESRTAYKKVFIAMRKSGGDAQPYLEVKLENVLISSYSDSGASAGDQPTQSLSLNFTKIEFKTMPMDEK